MIIILVLKLNSGLRTSQAPLIHVHQLLPVYHRGNVTPPNGRDRIRGLLHFNCLKDVLLKFRQVCGDISLKNKMLLVFVQKSSYFEKSVNQVLQKGERQFADSLTSNHEVLGSFSKKSCLRQ